MMFNVLDSTDTTIINDALNDTIKELGNNITVDDVINTINRDMAGFLGNSSMDQAVKNYILRQLKLKKEVKTWQK